MKKSLSLLLAALMVAGLAACGGSSSAPATSAAPAAETEAPAAETEAPAAETEAAAEVDYSKLSPASLEYHSLAAIKQRGELHIATEATFAPYAFKDADGNLVGLEVSLVNQIAEDMGVKCVIDDMAFDSVLPSVQAGLDDCAFAALTPTAERQEAFTFTKSYFSNGQMSLCRVEDVEKFKDESAMVAGVTMGAQKGTYQQTVAETLYPDCTGRYLEAVPNVVMDLKAGNIDIAIMDYDNAYAYAYQNEDLETAFVVPMLEGDAPSNCAASMLGNEELTECFNTLIDEYIADGRMQQWYEDAVALQLSLTE